MKYFYGPVPSRRLGFSLGVDLIPKKTCSFDCIYCQLGKTTKKTITRCGRIKLDILRKELREVIARKPRMDYITISGSGEPTLHKNLDKIIGTIKTITKNKYPICVITNSSLLYRKEVRKELESTDLIIPSLDAATPETFYKIDRPMTAITFKKTINGLVNLRKEFKGKIWLEIMLVAGINDSLKEAKRFKALVQKIKPDEVQLNLPVRPSSSNITLPSAQRLNAIKKIIGGSIEVVSSFQRRKAKAISQNIKVQILNYLRRRPANLDDLRKSLGVSLANLIKNLNELLKNKQISIKRQQKSKYFIIND